MSLGRAKLESLPLRLGRFARSVNQKLQRVWDDLRPRWRRARRRRWRRFELCGGQINPMRFRIERHRARTAFGLERLHDGKFVRCFLFRDGRRAFTA